MLTHVHLWLALLRAHGVLPPRGALPAGFLFAIWAILSAIFSVVQTIVTFVADAAVLVFNTILDVAAFAAKGVVWLAGTIRDGLAAALGAIKSAFGWLTDSLNSIWEKVSDFYDKVKAFLKPITDFLHNVLQIYDHYWKEFVQPVLNTITRIRQALQIFKYFHLQWASQVDSWLSDLQNQLIKDTLWLRQQIVQVLDWVNAVSDPFGFLKIWPLFGGFVNGVDSFWMALTGSHFFGAIGTPHSAGPTAHVTQYLAGQVSQLQSGTGDAGDVQTRSPGIRSALYNEMGVSQPKGG